MGREFVFVHGMSHGAWCWAPLVERLEPRGHRTLAVDLPGHGRRAHEWRRASVTTYAKAVADNMAAAGFSAAVVVGHSMAAVVIPKVAELATARVAHLAHTFLHLDARCSKGSRAAEAVPPARATDYAARLGVKPIDLDTAHDPMLSDPDALVAILERI